MKNKGIIKCIKIDPVKTGNFLKSCCNVADTRMNEEPDTDGWLPEWPLQPHLPPQPEPEPDREHTAGHDHNHQDPHVFPALRTGRRGPAGPGGGQRAG